MNTVIQSSNPPDPSSRQFLNPFELANRWGLSAKTLQRWRLEGRGPVFAKMGKRVSYPLHGKDGVLDYENRIIYRSTSERADRKGGV